MISCFLERIRRKSRSLVGSISLTVDLAYPVKAEICAPYLLVSLVFRVLRTDTPSPLTMSIPFTPLCPLIRLKASSTSLYIGLTISLRLQPL